MRSAFVIVVLAACVQPACALLLGVSGSAARRSVTIKAQLAPAPQKTKQKVKTNDPGNGGKGGGGGAPSAAIAKPIRKAHTEDVPLYKVLLLGDDEY